MDSNKSKSHTHRQHGGFLNLPTRIIMSSKLLRRCIEMVLFLRGKNLFLFWKRRRSPGSESQIEGLFRPTFDLPSLLCLCLQLCITDSDRWIDEMAFCGKRVAQCLRRQIVKNSLFLSFQMNLLSRYIAEIGTRMCSYLLHVERDDRDLFLSLVRIFMSCLSCQWSYPFFHNLPFS